MRTAACIALIFSAALTGGARAANGRVQLGLGAYDTKPRSGLFSGADPTPPPAPYRTGKAQERAAPTNQWYSSVMFARPSFPIYAQPMTYRATDTGFELGLPDRIVDSPDPGRREVRYPHVAAVVVSPAGFKPGGPKLSGFSDWLARITWSGDGGTFSATVLHGDPFSYYDCSSGDVDFKLNGAAAVLADPRDHSHDPRVAAFTIAGHSYAIFAPTGATWDWSHPNDIVLHLPAGRRYFSVAGLPNDKDRTIAAFLAVAYAFPTKTRAQYHYDQKTSTVSTTFRVTTTAMEGTNLTGFMGLYPHQWASVTPRPAALYTYDSVRGPIRLIAANSFVLEHTYHAFVPYWPGLEDAAHREAVDSVLVGDVARSPQLFEKQGYGTYWVGKGLGAAAQLMSVAKAENKDPAQAKLLKLLETRLETWFDDKHATHFMQDSTIGTFVGLPQEFGSVSHMNDHHFHYGYWLMASAYVAMNDPAWAAPGAWGGMVDKLVADIATDQHGRADFPYIRNFDAYEGHSWASGDAAMDDGNNQESSSEAVNAWAGLILWGAATGNTAVRDLGIYLYTSEIASIQTYWFDIKHQVLAPDFGKPFASMVFGDKYAYNTWWTEEPRQILGINMMPITPASIYLGRDPSYDESLMADLPAEVSRYARHGVSDGTPADIWQDVLASFLALADPQAGLAHWNKHGTAEAGETRTHTMFWLYSLGEMGTPDFSTTADTPLYSVFKNAAGVRTYLAYDASAAPIKVTFSTGKVIEVQPHSLARAH